MTMPTDTVTPAARALAALISATEYARLRAIEAAARALRVGAAKMADRDGELPWWRHYRGEDWDAYCIACGAEAISTGGARAATLTHAPDCAAMALDAALASEDGPA